jgi:hypothetical protein
MMYDSDPIRSGQKLALLKLIEADSKQERLFIISGLLKREVSDLSTLTIGDWREIRNQAYPNWSDNIWDVSKEFRALCGEFARLYKETELGQLRLL